MSVKHVNRKRDTYFLHEGKTKTGKPKYFFSKESEGIIGSSQRIVGAFGAALTTGFLYLAMRNCQSWWRSIAGILEENRSLN